METKPDIIHLNVGGRRFTTSKQTLTWVPESFFVSLLSGRVPSLKDETGAIFIDRDPDLFQVILQFLRTKEVDPKSHNIHHLKTEAEFFGLQPLVLRLSLCDELDRSMCGDLLFSGILHPQDFGTDGDSNTGSQQGLSETLNPALTMTSCGNWIGVAYQHSICCYKLEESLGWQKIFHSPFLPRSPEKICINTKGHTMLAASIGNEVKLWNCEVGARQTEIGTFDLKSPVNALFFMGPQLIAISAEGKVGVWHYSNQNWTAQGVNAITSYTSIGSLLVWGCSNGSVNSIDVQKFPLRMSDNDLLIVELFNDPLREPPTAMSVFGNPGVGNVRNSWSDANTIGRWLEVAYGTASGKIRIVVQHPENFGHGFQVVQTLTVHNCLISTIFIGEKYLISECADGHVRSWKLTRFRGRLATQPGPTPLASYRLLSLESQARPPLTMLHGPYGELDNQQLFLQKVIPDTNTLFVRLSATGDRVCKIQSVDGSTISSAYVHECEALGRLGYRPRKFVFTGHTNGSIQLWDLTQTLNNLSDNSSFNPEHSTGGPTQEELLELLQQCDVSTSRASSRITSLNASPTPSYLNLKLLRPLNSHNGSTPKLQRATSMHSLSAVPGSPSVRAKTGKKTYLAPSNLPQVYSSSNSSISTEENEFIIRVRSEATPLVDITSDSPLLAPEYTQVPVNEKSELATIKDDPTSPSQIYGEVSEITPTEINAPTTFDYIENEGEYNV